MIRKGIFWTIGKALYFVYYPIIYYQRIKFIGFKEWIWEDSSEIMVSVENAILVNTVVFIVWYKILW